MPACTTYWSPGQQGPYRDPDSSRQVNKKISTNIGPLRSEAKRHHWMLSWTVLVKPCLKTLNKYVSFFFSSHPISYIVWCLSLSFLVRCITEPTAETTFHRSLICILNSLVAGCFLVVSTFGNSGYFSSAPPTHAWGVGGGEDVTSWLWEKEECLLGFAFPWPLPSSTRQLSVLFSNVYYLTAFSN